MSLKMRPNQKFEELNESDLFDEFEKTKSKTNDEDEVCKMSRVKVLDLYKILKNKIKDSENTKNEVKVNPSTKPELESPNRFDKKRKKEKLKTILKVKTAFEKFFSYLKDKVLNDSSNKMPNVLEDLKYIKSAFFNIQNKTNMFIINNVSQLKYI